MPVYYIYIYIFECIRSIIILHRSLVPIWRFRPITTGDRFIEEYKTQMKYSTHIPDWYLQLLAVPGTRALKAYLDQFSLCYFVLFFLCVFFCSYRVLFRNSINHLHIYSWTCARIAGLERVYQIASYHSTHLGQNAIQKLIMINNCILSLAFGTAHNWCASRTPSRQTREDIYTFAHCAIVLCIDVVTTFDVKQRLSAARLKWLRMLMLECW